MPELPEVETVRRGLAEHAAGRQVSSVVVHHPRTTRRQVGGAQQFAQLLSGARLDEPRRRGKFLWFPLSRDPALRGGRVPSPDPQPPTYLVAHLGMSGQFRVGSEHESQPHVRVVVDFADAGPPLAFVDQRTFGWLAVEGAGVDGDGQAVPSSVTGIARDVLEEPFDEMAWQRAIRGRRTTVKRALLDQSLQSGIGNIYADETLWRARIHPERPTTRLSRSGALELLGHSRAVLREALAVGGTSFDSLYVDVNGSGGYFARHLAVYGRSGKPCPRCGTPVVRTPFANRSSHYCPQCQPAPGRGRAKGSHP